MFVSYNIYIGVLILVIICITLIYYFTLNKDPKDWNTWEWMMNGCAGSTLALVVIGTAAWVLSLGLKPKSDEELKRGRETVVSHKPFKQLL